jgi:hypothetical protein
LTLEKSGTIIAGGTYVPTPKVQALHGKFPDLLYRLGQNPFHIYWHGMIFD